MGRVVDHRDGEAEVDVDAGPYEELDEEALGRRAEAVAAAGEEATSPTLDAERLKFTGPERDLNVQTGANPAADDLDYMHARFCNPQLGRFLSPDPRAMREATAKPQQWNRYTYALNNPLRWLDPDGRQERPPDSSATTPDGAIEYILRYFRNWWIGNVMLAEDPEQARAREQLEKAATEGAAAALVVRTFADIFDSAAPDGENPSIRRKNNSADEAREQFNDAVEPESVQDKGGGTLVGTDKETGNTLIFRERSTDPAATATIEEQRKTDNKIRSRKVRFDSP